MAASIVLGTHRYQLVKTAKTWWKAINDSINRGGYLAQIESQAENTAIYQHFKAHVNDDWPSGTDAKGRFAWLGGSDVATEGQWTWRDGSNVSYSNWGTGRSWRQPDGGRFQNCMAMAFENWPTNQRSKSPGDAGYSGQWNDISSTDKHFYLIEFNQAVLQGTGDSITCSNGSADTLRYNQVAFKKSDQITGFDAGADKLELMKSAFGANSNQSLYVIREAAVSSSHASNIREQKRYRKEVKELGRAPESFIYNQGTGELWFNANGSKAGVGSGGVFATFDAGTQLTDNNLSFL